MKYLVDLSEFSYEDYKKISNYIDETCILESKQSTEVNKLIAKLKDVNNKLEKNDLSENTAKEMREVIDELNEKAEEIRKSNINIYTTIVIVTEVIKFIKIVIKVVGFIRNLVGKISEGIAEENKKLENMSQEEIEGLQNQNANLKELIQTLLKEVGKSVFSKETLKSIITDFFSVKNLVITALSILNKIIGKQAAKYLEYEKVMDKTYEMLVQAEAKIMIEKRQAKENKDKYTEECCDKVIEYIENMKKERAAERKAQSESALLEYSGNEYNVNIFKIAISDISNALQIEVENLRAYCNTATYILRRSLEMSKDTKSKKIELINKKINDTKDFVKNKNRQYDENTINTILTKYGNMFSTKYSEFGLAAREKFEKKLVEYSKMIAKIIKDYKDEVSLIVFEEKGKSINECIDKLSEKVTKKTSYETSRTIKRLFSEVDEDSSRTLDFCTEYISWCKKYINTEEVRNSIGYIVMNKLFKS